MDDRRGSFNLKAVIRETGLKPDTLRAWERRYGIPQPERTPGGHRLYSQRQIDCLRWLVARQREGLSISRAVDLWQTMEADGLDPLVATSRDVPLAGASDGGGIGGEALAGLRQSWVRACIDLDEPTSEQSLNQAFALYPPETVGLEVLAEGLRQIGQGWYQGDLSVQQEHFASALAVRRLEALLVAAPAASRRARLLVGCPPGEQHTFAPLFLTLALRRRGYSVTYLGAEVPLEHMEDVLASVKPHLAILTAQRLWSAAGLRELAQLIDGRGTTVAFGGLAFVGSTRLQARIPGQYLGDRLGEAATAVERLLGAPVSRPQSRPAAPALRRALAHVRSRQPVIDAQIWKASGSSDGAAGLGDATGHFGQSILAALELGDLSLLDRELEWLAGLLAGRGRPSGTLRDYLVAYREAARLHTDEPGRPVIEWLDQAIRQIA